MDLSGRLGVVAGASRGIGEAAAAALAGAGATVVRLARSLPDGTHGPYRDIRCDLTDAAQLTAAIQRILTDYGIPDVVVNSAGTFLLRPLDETDLDAFDAQVRINLRAPFALARALLPAMRERGRGLFINVGSVADHVGYAGNAAYAAGKYGLRGLHETLTAEYQGTGVRLTLVSPGPTDTAVWDPVDPDGREGFIRRAEMLRPEDVADAILFVATRPDRVHVDWLRLGPATTR